MKIIFVVLLSSLLLFSSDLLNIHRKLIPMTLLQIKTIAKKSDKTIKILIITKENELLKAHKLQNMFSSSVKNFTLETQILQESDIQEIYSMKFDAIYAFSLDRSTYKLIQKIVKKRGVVSFSNTNKGLKNGILIYIDKKKRIRIYINSKMMKQQKIPFSSKFLSIVEIVT